ncbi:MAG: 16S rRNA (cytidine(1402)-2'-O)-methyltransferase, partial [Verrucomicrobia bacterium]|nr:16S rRNA (cytidine(1402)-2'-O)-methyltransferase [Verrucomicrobiota bacterium]
CYEIHKPLLSYHEFNEARRTAELVENLRNNQQIALVSDAGMPMLSDPGLRLLRAAIDEGIPVEVIPGPSALTASLAVSGLAVEPFLFLGFLPHKGARRRRLLDELAPLPHTLVAFESPHRIHKALADIHELLGDRRVVIARELTKKFEQVLRDHVSALRKSLENRAVKGEITLLIEGNIK